MSSNTEPCKSGVEPRNYAYTPLKPLSPEIRVLELLAGGRDEPIRCELRKVSLDCNPTYEALSYVWGDSTRTRPIQLGGCRKDVTTNLEIALRHLRRPSRTRILWVDAVCINQTDMVERAQQVEKMHAIYSQASHVIAWTGEANENSDEALETIAELGSFFRGVTLDFDDLNDGHKSLSARLTSLGFPINNQNWKSVWDFFARPYWTRMWVIQELVSRGSTEALKPCTIYCGDKKVDKVHYNYTCYCLALMQDVGSSIDPDTGDFDGPIVSLVRDGRGTSSGLMMWQTVAYCDGTWDLGQPTMRRLLGITRQFKATDDRDKIYALLGMAPVSQRAVQPDYTKSTRTLLIDYVKGFVRRECGLNSILSARSQICSAGPSWTPEIHSNHHATDHWDLRNLDTEFRASNSKDADVEFDDTKGLMRSRGVLIGEISRVIGPQQGGDDISNGAQSAKDLLLSTGQIKVYRELATYARSLDDKAYDTFWRTLVLDQDEPNPLAPPIHPAPPERARESRVYFDLEPIPSEFCPDLDLPPLARNISYILPYSKRLITLLNRTFITTKVGHMGLGPYCAKVGDVVAVLFGCDRCVVLRPIEDGYQVVGDAYVHGAMQGQFVQGPHIDEKVFDLY